MNKLLLTLVSTMVLSACSAPYTGGTTSMNHLSTQNKWEIKKSKIDSMVTANGSPWIYVGESIGNDRYYVNIESIKPGSTLALRDATKAWWKTVGPNNAYYILDSEFYCSSGSSKIISRLAYSASDEYLYTTNGTLLNSHSDTVVPDTAFSNVYDLVCDLS